MAVVLGELGMWAVVAALCYEGHWLIAGGVFLLYLQYHPGADFWKIHFGDARCTALKEAGSGAGMIALALLALLRMGQILPAWSPFAALAVIVWGCLRLFRGAKFSVGWRDWQLIALALIEAGIGVAVYVVVWTDALPVDIAATIAASLYATAPYGELAAWALAVWFVVSGLTKAVLVLRGYPAMPLPNPGKPHGGADFWNNP